MSFGENIIAARERVKMKQLALAKKLKIRASVLSRYETGKRIPRADLLGRIAEVCKVPIGELYVTEKAAQSAVAEEPTAYAPDVPATKTDVEKLKKAQEKGFKELRRMLRQRTSRNPYDGDMVR